MTARTTNFDARTDAFSANPVVAGVASTRAMQNDLTPRQQQIRDNGRRRVDALLATGLYGPVHA
ncbi:hypothetical protein ASD93_02450 [Microbacterium sp. Root180]|nr:hypothetical protein ASD93_02450 [Microbacterium sp. Root180]